MANLFLFVLFIITAGIHTANGANISIDDASVTETSGGVFIYFDVNMDAVDTSNDTTINYTVSDGTATDPNDYDGGGGSGSVVIPKFGSSVQIGMATYDDAIYEGNENFTVTITSVSRGNSISDATATGTIIDNEGAPVINIVNAVQAPEGNTGNIADISLSHAASVDINVDYAFADGTAINGVDFTGTDGTATIPALSTSVGVPATTTTDGINESTFETFTVTISNPSLGSLGSSTTETVNIVDVDGGLSIDDVTVSETAGNATVTVTLQGPTLGVVTVDYATANSTAMAGSDYTGVSSTTLTFAATGNTLTPSTQSFTIPITDDSIFEGSESFTVSLSSVTGAAVLTDSDATVTITDNESTPTVDFNAATSSGSEGTSSATVQLDLSTASASAVTVSYTATGGTASGSGTDYTLGSGTFTIPAGSTSSTLSFATIVDDSIAESGETIEITLSGPSGATLGSQTAHTFTITDNESTPTVDFNAATSSSSEGTASATVQLDLSTASSSAVTVSYTATGGTASGSGTDYTLGSGTFTIPAGSTSSTLSFATIVDDSIAESGETIEITLSGPSGATLGSQTAHTFTVTDNDTALLSPSTQSVSGTVGSSITATTAYTATSFSGTLSYAVSPALPSGLSLDSSNGVVSGTPTAAQSATSYTITGTGSGSGSATATISITVATASAPALSPSTQSVSDTVGSSITATTAYTATSFSGTLSYAVSPALPSGLSLDSSNGVVSGTPTAAQSATSYTITGTGSGSGSATATISITVATASAPALSPSTQSVSDTVGSSITATTAYTATSFSGTLSYAVSPALPSGLSLDSSNGVVSGTPTAAQSATSYTITGTGSGSGSATATISITVATASAPALSPSTQSVSDTVGSSITATTAYTATSFSGTLSYAVSPALPSGLSLDSSNGVVSGTPTAAQSATSYTITGTGSGSGSATATISITVSASNTISNEVLTKAQSEVEVLWRSNDRLYNDRVTDQSRKILQLSLNDTLSGDCGTTGHSLCGATIEIANATRKIGKPDLVVKAGLPEIAVSANDDSIDAKASFADVKKLLGAGSKRIVSVASEYVDHKGDTSTHSLMASVAREYFDKGKNATLGVMTHVYRAKTDVKSNYSGTATTEGINFGSYTNYFGNKNYVMGFYGSLGFSRTKYDLTSSTTNVKNDFDAWNAQMGANVMGKRKFKTVLYMPKITLDTFLTKQKNSMPLVTAGSAVRHGFIASRVLSEVQMGFRPHFKIANINNRDEKITKENLTQEIDFNPQIYCGYSANTSDCGLGIGITNKWKPKDGDTEYRLGGDFSEYRGERKTRLEFNMETEINGNPNAITTTTISNNNIAKVSGKGTEEIGVNWRFDYRF